MPLYKVKLATNIMVWVGDNNQAEVERIALENAAEELTNDMNGVAIKKIVKLADIPKSWRTSIPWGQNGASHTCEELYKNPELGQQEQKSMKQLVCSWCDESATFECCSCHKHYCKGCSNEQCGCEGK